AATKIFLRDQNFRVAISGLVQHKIRVFAAILLIAELREEAFAESRALDRLKILFWDDHVGVDIHNFERRRDTGERGEFFHFGGFPDVLRGCKLAKYQELVQLSRLHREACYNDLR